MRFRSCLVHGSLESQAKWQGRTDDTSVLQIVAVPYETGFDHERISDDVQLKMTTCLRAIAPEIRNLPVYGAGHSLGSLLTLMVNSRFGVHRDGNALLSFNNRPATDSIPILTPLLGPGASAVGPILTQVR